MNGKPYRNGQGQTGNRHQGKNQSGRQGGQTIVPITAPYNFVPLSKKVFFPDWAKQVSHDVPFADGISGEIECELTTHTPIYVRNGGKWETGQVLRNPEAQSFFYVQVDGQKKFMIPGTSLKGMLRNVVEIASFGKMTKVDDHRYSIRDLHNRRVYLDKMKNVMAGWLVKSKDGVQWEIIPCDYALVSHKMLGNEKIKEKQTSLNKYKIWGKDKLEVTIDFKKGSPNNRVTSLKGKTSRGRLVFTGQPTRNDGGKFNKSNEFVFFNDSSSKRIAVPIRLQQDICFIYTNPNTGKPYEEWAEWQKVLDSGGKVPIFYQVEGSAVASFGFTRMYRLPYTYSVYDAIRNVDPQSGLDHFNKAPDLAEIIFGNVDGNLSALKGRISISPAVALNPAEGKVERTVLGAPKASYYPNYIEQPENLKNGNLDHNTFMDKGCNVRGWKRYPARELNEVKVPDGVGDNVDTCLIPLREGVRFAFSIKLHNVKPVELGALVWALSWGNNPQLRHSLGMGKSMGFGVADIKIKSASLRDMADTTIDWQSCMNTFVGRMDQEVGGDWLKTAQMVQLLAMADPTIKPQCGELKHMELAKKRFQNAKSDGLRLEPHVKPTTLAQTTSAAITSTQETWPQVRLSFTRGPRLLLAQAEGGKRAEVQLTGSFANLVPEAVLNAIPKGKTIPADVIVEKLGSKWRIIAVKPL